MEKALKLIIKNLNENHFEKCVFSSPRDKKNEIRSIVLIKVSDKNKISYEERLVKHNNIKTVDKNIFTPDEVDDLLSTYKQVLIKTQTEESQILINKKLIPKIKTKSLSLVKSNNNKKKKYIIPDGAKCDFLIEIGVMDPNGKVKPNYYKKFRQINRFLEMVDDLYKNEDEKVFHAVDFGCGKSYLTFALYYYFKEVKKTEIKISGIDLKEDVITHCNDIARKLDYKNLQFVHGFIHDFKTDSPVDFVVTLHACDTATDDAILFSLRNKAKKMMFVPCCQHELNKQITNTDSNILIKHGIFRDRLTSLITDTMRTQLLEICGYKVQSMEFIDLEHTAKNVLLRCVSVNRSNKQKEESLKLYYNFKEQWGIDPYLEKQLVKEKYIL